MKSNERREERPETDPDSAPDEDVARCPECGNLPENPNPECPYCGTPANPSIEELVR